MYYASEHSDDQNIRWSWLRAIEWINWPLFLSQPIMPVLLYFRPMLWDSDVFALIILTVAWQLWISRQFASVRLADFGSVFVHLKWISCPAMAYLLWSNNLSAHAVAALLWPIAVLVIQLTINIPLGVIFKSTAIGPVQNLFMLKLGYARTTSPTISAPDWGVKSRELKQPWKRAFVPVYLLIFIVGFIGVWLANSQWTPVSPSTSIRGGKVEAIGRSPSLPNQNIQTTGSFEDAYAAYHRADYVTALRLYHQLAEQGNDAAQYNLGLMYLNGRGTAQNDAEAVRWFRLAADQGHVRAQNNLGSAYLQGRGVAKDYAEAFKWLRKAADRGHAVAQFNLGTMYVKGVAVPPNDVEAVKWFRLAADQGHAGGQFGLGGAYYYGRGVQQDYVEALRLFRLAADQGHDGAETYLASMYADGLATSQNYVNAYMWYSLAAKQGNALAAQQLDLIEQRMTRN